ncbi:MAG: PLP-dependent aminotransferase family protein, partial [Oxalicibacterium faecigallinarum]|nr:PLP-dependent aminotransferase family protein [Oxalicibacterium faecigallinarum]
WVRDGTADLMLNAIRKESAARQKLAARILPPGSYQSKPDAFHLWINLPPAWEQKAFAAHLAESGVGVVPSDAFCVSGPPPAAVRVCIGGLANRDDIQHGLEMIAQALRSTPKVAPAVV